MTGCQTDPAPTGEALLQDAEQTYMEYRTFVNGVQSVLSTDPWTIGQLGEYGMQPNSCGNGAGYAFSLGRSLHLDVADREKNADTVAQYLKDKGLSPVRRTLGTPPDSLIQVALHDQAGLAQLLIEFGRNGTTVVSATTTCRPGNALDLADMMFGDVYLGQGYLPVDVEAPTDPLFFGITPGEPKFVRQTPAPTDTPAP